MAQQTSSSPSSLLCLDTVDDFYLSVVSDDETDPNVPVSDDKYAEALQLQETLLSSLITSQQNPSSSSTLPPPLLCVASSSKTVHVDTVHTEEEADNNESSSIIICEICAEPKTTGEMFRNQLCYHSFCTECVVKQVATKIQDNITNVSCPGLNCKGLLELESCRSLLPKELIDRWDDALIDRWDESSSMINCEICAEPKTTDEMFRNQLCYHSFCTECVVKQVATKIQDNITNVSCPGLNCKGLLELESCRSLLPKELIDRWDDALCEALLLTVPKFYCPFKDCSAMLLDENEGAEDIRESECPFCHRLFCARCHVPWHPGIGCEEYQKLNADERGRDDLLVWELANQKKWKRCPRCRFYVEKRDGCLHITCRCKFEFCYACGETWTTTHGGCQRN